MEKSSDEEREAGETAPLAEEDDSSLVGDLVGKDVDNAAAQEFRDFDDVLRRIGGWGRYQIRLLLLCMPFTLFLAYAAYSPILFLYVPEHWCRPDPALSNRLLDWTEDQILEITSPKERDEGSGVVRRSRCHRYDVDFSKLSLSEILGFQPNETTPTAKCSFGMGYNFTGYFTTAATDMDWVCDDAWRGAFTQSLFYVGGVVGTLFFGYTADRLGRVWTVLASNAVLGATGLATPFCSTFASFSAVRFAMGISHVTFFAVFLLLALEYVSIERRAFVGNMSLAVAITIGGCYQPWLIRWLGDWKTFHHALYAQTLVVFLVPLFLHESIRWLASMGKVEKCVEIMREIAEINGKEKLEDECVRAFKEMVKRQKQAAGEAKEVHWTDLFTTPRLRRNFVVMIATWMLIAGMFDAHIRNIANLDYSIYATFTISSLLELPADLLAIWGLNFLGRRWSACLSQLLAGICSFLCPLFFGMPRAVTFLAMLGRFFITYAMNTGTQITYEVVPTVLRGQGNALANVFAQAAQFCAPYIVFSAAASPSLPFLILGFGSLLGAAVSVLLPETADVDLPDTVEEARAFGRGQSVWRMPCTERRKKKKELIEKGKEAAAKENGNA